MLSAVRLLGFTRQLNKFSKVQTIYLRFFEQLNQITKMRIADKKMQSNWVEFNLRYIYFTILDISWNTKQNSFRFQRIVIIPTSRVLLAISRQKDAVAVLRKYYFPRNLNGKTIKTVPIKENTGRRFAACINSGRSKLFMMDLFSEKNFFFPSSFSLYLLWSPTFGMLFIFNALTDNVSATKAEHHQYQFRLSFWGRKLRTQTTSCPIYAVVEGRNARGCPRGLFEAS